MSRETVTAFFIGLAAGAAAASALIAAIVVGLRS